MLEGVLESLLLHRLQLGEWIDGLDRSKLRVDIWSGSIVLRSLTLRPSALDRFDLPCTVAYGHVEELTIQIPWKSLSSQPVKISVKGVYLLLRTKDDAARREEVTSGSRAAALHRARIEEGETMRQRAKAAADANKTAAEAGFVENMVSSMLANLQVSIEKVHVRLEHAQQTPPQVQPAPSGHEEEEHRPPTPLYFAAGVTIASLTAVTTDADGRPEFVDRSKRPAAGALMQVRKTAECSDVAVYCNPGARSWSTLPAAAMRITFSNGVCRARPVDPQWWRNNDLKSSLHRFSFLLLPLSPRLDVRLNRSDASEPYVSLALHLASLPVSMTDAQLRALVVFAESLSSRRVQARAELQAIIDQCAAAKPNSPPVSSQALSPQPPPNGAAKGAAAAAGATRSNCVAWWRWSAQCVLLLGQVHRQRRRAGTSAGEAGRLTLLDRAHLFRAYVPLYKRTLGVSWLSPLTAVDEARMRDIELALEVRDILYYRSCAEAEVRLEADNKERQVELEKAQTARRGYVASWYGYLIGGDANKEKSKEATGTHATDGVELTPEQREAVWAMLAPRAAASASSSSSTGSPAIVGRQAALCATQIRVDAITLDVFELDGSVVTIDTPSAAERSCRLAQLRVVGFATDVRVDPIDVERTADGVDAAHPISGKLAVQGFEIEDCVSTPSPYTIIAQSRSSLSAAAAGVAADASAAKEEPYFDASYERDPTDGTADHRLRARVRGVRLVVQPFFFARLLRFLPRLREPTAAAAAAATPALRDLAAAMTADMQHEFMRSLVRQKKWDVELVSDDLQLVVPQKCATDQVQPAPATPGPPQPVLEFRTGRVVLRSHVGAAEASMDAGEKYLRRRLPRSVADHPDAYDQFSLSIDAMQMRLCSSQEVIDAPTPAVDEAALVPTAASLFLLAPLSLRLSVHLCVRTGLRDLAGRKLLLPRTIVSGILTHLRLQVTPGALVFAAAWIDDAQHAIQAAKMEENDPTQPTDAASPTDEAVSAAHTESTASSAPIALDAPPPSSVSDLPIVRTQLHGYFGIGSASLTVFTQTDPASTATPTSAVAFRPLARLVGTGCSALVLASVLESSVRVGCESVVVESLSVCESESPRLLASIASRHMVKAPGGANAHTARLYQSSPSPETEAMHLRIVTLLGAARRSLPASSAKPAADQFVDLAISCIEVNWDPHTMMEMAEWVQHIQWPHSQDAAAISSPLESPRSDSASSSVLMAASSAALVRERDDHSSASRTSSAPTRFFALVTARIEEVSFRCLDSATATSPPSPFVQIRLSQLYWKQGVYNERSGAASDAAVDHLLVAGIKEIVLLDCTPVGEVYPELLSCRVDQCEPIVADAFDDDAPMPHTTNTTQNDLSDLAPAMRLLLPSTPYPLLFTLDSCGPASPRYDGLESKMQVAIQGVAAVYVRERLDRCLQYATTGALGMLFSSSQDLAWSVRRAWSDTRHSTFSVSARHPTIIIPRSCQPQHRGQHVQVDLGHICVQVDMRLQSQKEEVEKDESNDDPAWPAHLGADALMVSTFGVQITKMNLTCPLGALQSLADHGSADGDVFFPSFSARSAPTIVELTPIVHDINFTLDLRLQHPVWLSQPAWSRSCTAPHLTVRGRLSDVVVKVSRLHYLLLMRIAMDNLVEGMPVESIAAGETIATATPHAEEIVEEAKEMEECKSDVEMADDSLPPRPVPPPSMSMDVRLQMDRLRVELLTSSSLSHSTSSSPPHSFAVFTMDTMCLRSRMSDEDGISVTITTKQMNIADCRPNQQARTIFYPLHTSDAHDALDELSVTWRRHPSTSSPTAPTAAAVPIPDRLSVVLSHPCVIALPEFWIDLVQFVATDDEDERTMEEAAASRANVDRADDARTSEDVDPDSAERSAAVGLVQRLDWLDMHVSVHNARAVLPQSAALDAAALVLTCDMHFTSTNAFPDRTTPATRANDNEPLGPDESSRHRTQEVEVLIAHLSCFGGTVDRPLASNLAHSMCTCESARATLQSTFGASHALPGQNDTEATTTAAIYCEPIAMQISSSDGHQLRRIVAYVNDAFEAAAKSRNARAKVTRTRNDVRGAVNSTSTHPSDWIANETEQQRLIIMQQQELYANQPCILVPQLLPEHDIGEDDDAPPKVTAQTTSRAAAASAPVLSFGWFQVIELRVASVSLIFLHDLNESHEVASGPSTGGNVPVAHLCLFDTSLVWSHPRAHAHVGESLMTDMMSCSVESSFTLTAYDAANVEWINVVETCAYDVGVDIQTQTSKTTTAGARRASGAISAPPVKKRVISMRVSARQPQEIRISDRLVATMMQLMHTINQTPAVTRVAPSSTTIASSVAPPPAAISAEDSFSSLLLKNSTRNSIRCRIAATSAQTDAPTTMVEPGQEMPVSFPGGLVSHVGGPLAWTYCSFEFASNSAISPPVDGEPAPTSPFRMLEQVPVSKIGTLVYELALVSTGARSGTFVQIVVSMHRASRRIEVKSLYSFTNSTSLPLEVRLTQNTAAATDSNSNAVSSLALGVVESSETIFLPLDEPNFAWTAMQLRPQGFNMKWNSENDSGRSTTTAGVSSELQRFALLQQARSVVVPVCKLDEQFVDPGPDAHVPSFVCQAVGQCTKHQATSFVAPPTTPTSSAASVASAGSRVFTYHRLHVEVFPPLRLSNLFLADMVYQLKYRASSSSLLSAGLLHAGDNVDVHDVDLRRLPMVRFQLLPAGAMATGVPKQTWSEWIGMEQVVRHPIVDFVVQVQQAGAPPVPLATQIHRSLSSHSGSITIAFLCPYWLNNQSGLPLAFTVQEEIYENERFLFFKWRAPSLPTDRCQWTDRGGQNTRTPPHAAGAAASVVDSATDCAWVEDQSWVVDVVPTRTDSQGWEYALDFPGPYHSANATLDAVRRRRWVRLRALRPITPNAMAPSPSASVASSPSVGAGPSATSLRVDSASVFRHVRMYGAFRGQQAMFAVLARGTPMPPSAPIDLARAATDSILVLAAPRSHRAAGHPVRSYELAVLVDHGPPPFQQIKILSFHARYQVHNETGVDICLRQIGLDERNPEFVDRIGAGEVRPFHPWICTPSATATPAQVNQFGVHLCIGHGAWSLPFPIQRIGEFSIKLPLRAHSQSSSSAADAMECGPMYFLRVKVELVRAILHVRILPESSSITVPSLLLTPEEASSPIRTGSMYRIDNRTAHRLYVQQLAPGAKPAGVPLHRAATAMHVAAFSSAVYAFDYFDLNLVGAASSDQETKSQVQQTVCVEVDRTMSEAERMHQLEREFTGLEHDSSHPDSLWSQIGLDEVGAETFVKLPNTYSVVETHSDDDTAPTIATGVLRCRYLRLRVVTDGPTRVLEVREVDLDESLEPQPDEDAMMTPVQNDPPVINPSSDTSGTVITLAVHVPEINIVVFNAVDPAMSVPRNNNTAAGEEASRIRELLFVQLRSLVIDAAWTDALWTVQVRLGRFQVDNPSQDNPIFPVILHSVHEGRSGDGAANSQSPPAILCFFHVPAQPVATSSVNGASVAPFCIDRVLVQVHPFRVNLDEKMMRDVGRFIARLNGAATKTSAAASRNSMKAADPARTTVDLRQLVDFLLAAEHSLPQAKASKLARMYYFRRLDLGALKFRVSYTPVDFTATTAMPVDPLHSLHESLGSVRPFLDCDDARLSFAAFQRANLFTSLPRLRSEVSKVFTAELMSQAVELLGRAKTFGNPIGMLSSVRTGLRELIQDPSLSRGAMSLISNTTVGVTDSAAGLTGSLSSHLAKLSDDADYLSSRAAQLAQDRPQNAREGVTAGVRHFGSGFIDGVSGLVSMPMAGAKADGFSGAMRGAGRGLIGLVVKPIAGTLDAAQKLSEGVRAQAAGDPDAGPKQKRVARGNNSPIASGRATIGTYTSASPAAPASSPSPSSRTGASFASASSSSSSSSSTIASASASASSLLWQCAWCSCFNARAAGTCAMCAHDREPQA